MHWLYPSWLWAQILPLLIFYAAILAYRFERRRLERFGDPQILGVRWKTSRRIVRTLLLVMGVGCVTAILAGPYRETRKSQGSLPLIEILLDFRSSGEPGREAEIQWEDLCDAVDSLVGMSSLAKYSVYRPGNPVELMIPDTFDTQGLLMVLNASPPPDTKGSSDRLEECLAALLSPPTEEQARRLVVITTRTREEITRLWLSATQPRIRPMFLRIRAETNSAEYAIPGESENWVWSTQPGILRSYEQNADDGLRRPSLWKRLSEIQLFAFAAFVLLSIEFVCPVFAPSAGGGGRELD